jgi:phage shock protein E
MAWIAGLALAVGMACGDGSGSDAARAAASDARPALERSIDPLVTTREVTPADTNVVFVDVRTREEYAAGHVAGAIHIPHTEMARRYAELDRYDDKQIILYCRTGRRSGVAQMILENQGFDNVVNGGGLRDLEAQGIPTTR